MLTASLRLVAILLMSACSGINPAREKVDSGPEDVCFIDTQPYCAAMTVCTTHINVMGKTWACDELDLNRNGRVDCLDEAEAFACDTLLMPRFFPPLNRQADAKRGR